MPFVNVLYNPKTVPKSELDIIARELRHAVAMFISEADPKKKFLEDEVTVRCEEMGKHDLCAVDMAIVVWTNHSLARRDRLKETARKISVDISRTAGMPGMSNYVYLRLAEAGFCGSSVPRP